MLYADVGRQQFGALVLVGPAYFERAADRISLCCQDLVLVPMAARDRFILAGGAWRVLALGRVREWFSEEPVVGV